MMVEKLIRDTFNWAMVMQALIVAVITAGVSGYVNARVLEGKVEGLVKEILRLEKDGQEMRSKLEEVMLRQASAISQANTIHDTHAKRIDRLEISK